MNYSEYMQTEQWRQRRSARLAFDNHCCVSCGRTNELEVHHTNYNRLGFEPMGDLITLCARCHNDAHFFPKIDIGRKMMLKQKPVTEQEYQQFTQGAKI